MPVIRSAKKKLRVDKKRESTNKKTKALINFIIKKTQRKPTPENMKKAFKAIDKGVKRDIFHKNKGARMKSKLSKLVSKKLKSTAKNKIIKPAITKKTKKGKK